MVSANPLGLADPQSYTEHTTTINGVKIPDVQIGNLVPFRSAVNGIPSRSVTGITRSGWNSSFSYTIPAYSAVAMILNGTGTIPTPSPIPTPTPTPSPVITAIDRLSLFLDRPVNTLGIDGTNF